MGKKYGYACVSSAYIRMSDQDALKDTKAYAQLKETFRILGLSCRNLHVDLITAKYRRRKKLEAILSSAKPGDVIIVATASALGLTTDELRDNYFRIVERSIGLFVWEEQLKDQKLERLNKYAKTYSGQPVHISTVGPDFRLPKELYYYGQGLPYTIVQTMMNLDQVNLRTNKGGLRKDAPVMFREVYWLYENYFIREQDALHNDAMDMGKKRFYRLATEYEEEDPDYPEDQLKQERLYQISKKPKRRGHVPEHFEEFLARVDSGEPLDKVIDDMGYPRLTPIDVERYRLKHKGGKSCLSLASYTADTPKAKELFKETMEKARALREKEKRK